MWTRQRTERRSASPAPAPPQPDTPASESQHGTFGRPERRPRADPADGKRCVQGLTSVSSRASTRRWRTRCAPRRPPPSGLAPTGALGGEGWTPDATAAQACEPVTNALRNALRIYAASVSFATAHATDPKSLRHILIVLLVRPPGLRGRAGSPVPALTEVAFRRTSKYSRTPTCTCLS